MPMPSCASLPNREPAQALPARACTQVPHWALSGCTCPKTASSPSPPTNLHTPRLTSPSARAPFSFSPPISAACLPPVGPRHIVMNKRAWCLHFRSWRGSQQITKLIQIFGDTLSPFVLSLLPVGVFFTQTWSSSRKDSHFAFLYPSQAAVLAHSFSKCWISNNVLDIGDKTENKTGWHFSLWELTVWWEIRWLSHQ